VYNEAFGASALDPTVPLTTDAVVDIGSTSKQFTATIAYLLASNGELDLDKAVRAYLPALPSWADTVTVRQMIHHQSGIPDYIEVLMRAGRKLSDRSDAADASSALAKVTKLDFTPGSSWSYSNSNYFLLGEVIAAVTKQPLGEVGQQMLFAPYGIDAAWDYDVRVPAEVSSFEKSKEGGWQPTIGEWVQVGDGGIRVTSRELTKWASHYWEPKVGAEKMLDAQLDRASTIPTSLLPEGGRYGLGIMEMNDPAIGRILTHAGGWESYVTAFEVVPEQKLVATATCLTAEGLDPALTSGKALAALWVS
jgi:CubicO group peptidase (beta-lactamase class C family)